MLAFAWLTIRAAKVFVERWHRLRKVHFNHEVLTGRIGRRSRFPARLFPGWDHLLMDQDDPEKRVAC
jgi:hypothetical protein